jgi:hypothetical protein
MVVRSGRLAVVSMKITMFRSAISVFRRNLRLPSSGSTQPTVIIFGYVYFSRMRSGSLWKAYWRENMVIRARVKWCT